MCQKTFPDVIIFIFHIKMQMFVLILLQPVFKLLFFNLFELRQFLNFFLCFSAITI